MGEGKHTAGPSDIEFAWLVEAPGLRYLAVRKAAGDYRGEFYWTPDASQALRFFNKEQADLTSTAVRRMRPELWGFAATLGEAWPRQHGWLARAAITKALGQKET